MGGRKKVAVSNPLLEAVQFVGLALKDKGAENEQFCMVNNQWITAFNGVVALGTRVQQQLIAAPHNKRLETALAACDPNDMQITQLVDGRLHVRSGDIQAFVPCCPGDRAKLLVWPTPDAVQTAVDDTFRAAIIRVGVLANAKAQSVLCAAIVLNSGGCIATNNTCIMEYWHGFGMRDGIQIPKVIVPLLNKIKRKLTGFGWSESSCTFHFEDGSWLKSMLYTEKNIDLRALLNKGQMKNSIVPPQDFFTVVGKLAKFAYDGKVYCGGGVITAYENAAREMSGEGAYEVPGAPYDLAFDAGDLLTVAPFVQSLDFRALPNAAMFYGDRMRMAVVWEDTMPKVEIKTAPPEWKPNDSSKCFACGMDWPNSMSNCPHCNVNIDDEIAF
jgi:hypothetical protein